MLTKGLQSDECPKSIWTTSTKENLMGFVISGGLITVHRPFLHGPPADLLSYAFNEILFGIFSILYA